MFGRKKRSEELPMPLTDEFDTYDLPMKSGARTAAAAAPARPPVMPPRAPAEAPRPPVEVQRRVDTPPPAAQGLPKRNEAETRKLIVGREISLSGEITACDRLVVEGSVEANLANCHDIEISESGFFKGSASIDDAEIRGRFEGVLHVRRRLLIRASGRVTGTIRYGQIEIECGGQISGDVQAQPTSGDSAAAELRTLVEAVSESGLIE